MEKEVLGKLDFAFNVEYNGYRAVYDLVFEVFGNR